MKKILSLVLIITFGIVVLTSSTPKKKKVKMFKGTISYTLSYDGETFTPLQISKMPKKLDVKMYGKMTSITMTDGPAVVTKINRPDDSVEIVLIDLGLKKAGLTRKDTTKNKEKFTTTIDYSDDTKIIAGYKCKKAVVTFTPKDSVDAEEQTLAVFYSPDFSGVEMNADGPYEGITGLLLEFYQVDEGLITKFVATDVKKGGVKELDFFFQSDYKEFKSGEELMKYLQGQ